MSQGNDDDDAVAAPSLPDEAFEQEPRTQRTGLLRNAADVPKTEVALCRLIIIYRFDVYLQLVTLCISILKVSSSIVESYIENNDSEHLSISESE